MCKKMSNFWDDWFKRFREGRGFSFPDIERMMDEMDKEMSKAFRDMENMIPRDLIRYRNQPDGSIKREYGPFIYGYSVNIGPDGKPIVREFGNLKPRSKVKGSPPLNLRDSREPLIDVIDESDNVKIIAELPGVEKEDIQLSATEKNLTIKVDKPERKYYKMISFPAEVDNSSVKCVYKNGVLEAVFKKKKESKSTRIPVE
jgi:HSP20 family protein